MLVDPYTPASLSLVSESTGADFLTLAESTQQPALDIQAQELWPAEWLHDADLWDPAPACPPECREDLTFSLLGPPDEQTPKPVASLSSEHTWDEATQLPGAAANAFGHQDEVNITLSGSPPRRRRTGQAASNREHQRNYRNRQRERAAATKARVASMSAELQKLKQRQQQLENRNALLEKLHQLSAARPEQGTYVEGVIVDHFPEHTYDVHETTASWQGPAIIASVGHKQQILTLTDLSRMSAADFTTLWSSYVQEIAALLLHDNPSPEVQASLNQLASETSVLIGIIKSLNPQAFSIFNQADSAQEGNPGLDRIFYCRLAGVMGLSEEQIEDHMCLRRLCVTKRGLLAMERKALIDHMAKLDCFNKDAPATVTQLSDLAARLRENAAKDYKVYLRLACASRRGMLSSRQWAIGIVHAYPLFPVLETWVTCMAAERGEPTRDQLLLRAKLDDKEEEWRDLSRYVAHVSSKFMHNYVPLSAYVKPEQEYIAAKGQQDSSPLPAAIFQVKLGLGKCNY